MKRALQFGTAVLVTMGGLALAQAGTPAPSSGCAGCVEGNGVGDVKKAKDYKGDLSVMLTEKIKVSVPAVVAMYLHENAWSVDLNNLENCECYRAGDHDIKTGRDVVYNFKEIMKRAGSKWSGDDRVIPGNPYSFAGEMVLAYNAQEAHGGVKVKSYPGIEYNNADNTIKWKGPIICFNRKIVEKFTNSTDWKVNIAAANVTAGFPTLILGDRVAGTNATFVETLYSNGVSTPLEFTNAQAGLAGKTTGGWLDDYIIEAVLFDGSETAGTKTADVNFKLTGTF